MQVAICDDERIFIEQLHEMVEKTGRIEKCDLYDNPDSIRAALRKNVAYDIVFMDIDWKREEENGIQYAAEINRLYPETNIIFTTSYNERFSQEIFWETVNLCGYLVKPVQGVNLQRLLDKIEKQRNSEDKSIVLKQIGAFLTIRFYIWKVRLIRFLSIQRMKKLWFMKSWICMKKN